MCMSSVLMLLLVCDRLMRFVLCLLFEGVVMVVCSVLFGLIVMLSGVLLCLVWMGGSGN